ncbi:MAG TPA: transglycosylase domain-containing protein [Solirubrobacteraceae bacterium]|nr:transglycosylase domain-containing protein [Solirubrobacteraceae bacterium]
MESATLPGAGLPAGPAPPAEPRRRARLKKLRFLLIFLALGLLGVVSFVFGMFMAVASDLPQLEAKFRQDNARNSVLLDDRGKQIGMLSERDQVLVTQQQIPPIVRDAVISIEDKRFMTNSGIDLRSLTRAFVTDVLHQGAVQGASTIEQQFVKNALGQQAHRTILEKLREAALAFHLAHHWSKLKILTEYLNTIYFGNGAYGIEAAAQTYFGQEVNHRGCGLPGEPLCVQELEPWEAALLAGIIQSPTQYNPVTDLAAARARRNVVLGQMYQQGYLNRREYEESTIQALPAPQDIAPPLQPLVDGIDTGYFDNWVGQQVVDRYGAERAYYGGLKIRTTLDLGLQRAAERAVAGYLPGPEGPTAALVAIESSTGKVRAMVGGRGYDESPFNLATEGERQPGSSFKAFDLAAALEDGISPNSVWSSRVKTFKVPHSSEAFVVHNDENAYAGSDTLTGATAYSDNSIYAEVGLKVGTHRIAALARRMGITTPISTNPAMTIGGLKTGVTPLDMAHAYETIAHGGQRVSGTLSEPGAPVGIEAVQNGSHEQVDRTSLHQVLPGGVASTETEMLETVLAYGTARSAALGQFAAGKTGTTSNYGDAWFVGWDHRYTVAVWVGFPNSLVPMLTEFNGGPVLGGTFPALIWHSFMVSAMQVEKERTEEESAKRAAAAAARAARAGGGQTTTSTGEASGALEGAATAPSPTPAEATPRAGGSTKNGAKEPPSNAPASPEKHGEGAQPQAQQSPQPGSPSPATPAPAAPAPAGGAPNQAPATPETPASQGNSGGTSAPTGGASPGG